MSLFFFISYAVHACRSRLRFAVSSVHIPDIPQSRRWIIAFCEAAVLEEFIRQTVTEADSNV